MPQGRNTIDRSPGQSRNSNHQPKRHRNHRGPAAALTAGAAIAAGTQAYGVPVRYDNPPEGHPDRFEWAGHYLNLTKDAPSQADVPTDSTFIHVPVDFLPWYSWLYGSLTAHLQLYGPGSLYVGPALSAGDVVPTPTPGTSFSQSGLVAYYGYSNLPANQAAYLGFRFDLGEGYHYAWAKVVLGGEPVAYFLDALAWGYETEPGVPIAAGAPEPGTLAALAFGVGLAAGRRRE